MEIAIDDSTETICKDIMSMDEAKLRRCVIVSERKRREHIAIADKFHYAAELANERLKTLKK